MKANYKISIINVKTGVAKRSYTAEYEGDKSELQEILNARYSPSIVKIEPIVFVK